MTAGRNEKGGHGAATVLLGCAICIPACHALQRRSVLIHEGESTWQQWVGSPEGLEIPERASVLRLESRRRRLPDSWSSPAFRQRLGRFVSEGGGLLLLGYAVRLAADLGLATEAPEQSGAYHHGLRGEAGERGYRFGLAPTRAGREELALGQGPIWLGSGIRPRLEYCLYAERAVGKGMLLARFARSREGHAASRSAALIGWKLGRGRVLSLGLGPIDPDAKQQLMPPLLRWLQSGSPGGLLFSLSPLDPAPRLDRWAAREKAAEHPAGMFPEPAHFGLSLSPGLLEERRGIWPSIQAALSKGANLFLARAGDDSGGRLPFPWSDRDDLMRPDSYLGGGPGPRSETLRRLAAELHEHGAQLGLQLPDQASLGASRADSVQIFRFLVREMADLASQGPEALDGMGGAGLEEGPLGLLTDTLWKSQPAAFFLASDPTPAPHAASVGCILPRAGRLAGLALAGLAEPELGAAFRPGLQSLLQLETRPEHGAHLDWIHRQASDFTRGWGGRGAAIVLDLHELPPASKLSLWLELIRDPLSTAVSLPQSSTGLGGLRHSLQALLAGPAPELEPNEALCSTTVLENRYFRLEGSGGALRIARRRTGDFRRQESLEITDRFMSARIRGARPGPGFLTEAKGSFQPGVITSPGSERIEIDLDQQAWPGRLSRVRPWPSELRQKLRLPPGHYRLSIQGHPVGGSCLLEVSLGNRILGYLAGNAGGKATLNSEFGLASERALTLSLRIVHGTEFVLSAASYERIGGVGEEVVSEASAGPRVAQREELWSSFYSETRRLVTLGDLPGFLLDVRYRRVSHGLRLDRFFRLPGYRARYLSGGPFVLSDRHGIKPALWLYPIGLGRNHHPDYRQGEGLLIESYPRNHDGFHLAVLLADDLAGVDPRSLRPALEEILHPSELEPRAGRALVAKLAVQPWRRCFRISPELRGPIEVREGSRWRWAHPSGSPENVRYVAVGAHDEGQEIELRFDASLEFRPTPGADRLLSVERRENGELAVHVRQSSPFARRVGLRFGKEPGGTFLDGRDWRYRDGPRVFLPTQPGTYVLRFDDDLGMPASLIATPALVRACRLGAWPGGSELRLELGDPPHVIGAPPRLPLYSLLLQGPPPDSVIGATLTTTKGGHQYLLQAPPGTVRILYRVAAGSPR